MEQTELLKELNRFTRREHSLDEVFLFDIVLCDNEIDRDGERFSEEALRELQKRFVGVTGIFDHMPRAGAQTARIFRTEVCADDSRRTKAGAPYRFLRANAYMVRTDGNADLIREIDAGIKKEVSISCAVGMQRCSVCGANLLQNPCGHIRGKRYGGAPCHAVLNQITDVYEWSFVAVPAQPAAGVTKTCGAVCDPEKDALRRRLDALAETVSQMTERLRQDVVRLCFRGGETPAAKALADAAVTMPAEALLKLKKSLEANAVQKPEAPQISADGAGLQPYRFGGKGD